VTEIQGARLRDPQVRHRWDNEWLDLAIAMTTSFLLLVPTGLLSLPPRIDRITITNPTVYDISVAVSDGDGEDWVSVLTVGHDGTDSRTNVIDQGDTWQFHFRGQGRDGGELTVTRPELVASDWQLTIPVEVGERLAELGAPPSS
jgi:hypothetical protein